MGEASQSRTPDTQLFRDVFNASPIGIVVENLEGQPLFVNPAFCSMLGFSEEELRSKHSVDFSPREEQKETGGFFSNYELVLSTNTNLRKDISDGTARCSGVA
jgi:PAS domain S-box-containing protein